MRRLVAITAFALVLAAPLWAQHGGGGGGGHVGGGPAGGFSGGHAASSGGHVSGGNFSSGSRSGPGMARSFTRPSFSSQRNFSRGGPYLHDGFRGSRFGTYGYNRGYRNGCYGYGCRGGYGYYGYPWYPWYAGYSDPWWWDSGSSYDEDYERDRALADEADYQGGPTIFDRRGSGADSYVPPVKKVPAPHSGLGSAALSVPEPQEPTLLIFKDGHKLEVGSYAIVGLTLADLTPGHQRMVALADLDLGATRQQNVDRGIIFHGPQQVPRAN